MYEYLDRVLKRTVLRIYRVFQQHKRVKFDELNVIAQIQELYRELERINREAYEDIGMYYFLLETDDKTLFSPGWLDEALRTPSPVMKYSYDSEVVRKRDRLMEALIATNGASAEYDKAMRYWTQMTGWFAIEVADAATAQARRVVGVEFVRWMSEHDDKVCGDCFKLDGQVFPVEQLPPKPHPNCRCWTEDLEGKYDKAVP